MSKRKFLAMTTATIVAFSMMFSSAGTTTVNAEELEVTEEGLLTDDAGPIVVKEAANKNAVDSTITIEGDPMVSTQAASSNTSADNASLVTVNSMQYDLIAKEKQQRWFYLWSDAGKLTVDLTAPYSTGVDYDVYIYQYNDEEGSITLVSGSENEDTADEHFAMMTDAGVYFIMVNGYSGYDAVNSFQLGIGHSSTYDAAEIDDTYATAKTASIPFSITGTIDNAYDHDYVKITVTEAGAVSFTLTNNGSTSNSYRMDVYNAVGTNLGYLPQGYEGTIALNPGNYFLRTRATEYGGDGESTYTLTGSFKSSASRVTVTKAGDAFIDYGHGKYWRIINSANVVTGTAYDANGNPAANANIEIQVDIVKGNETRSVSGTTDSNGNFSIRLNIGDGSGEYMYDSGVSYHYYDVVPIRFYSNGTRISSDISYIYHFAYQVGHPF